MQSMFLNNRKSKEVVFPSKNTFSSSLWKKDSLVHNLNWDRRR